MKTNWKFVDFDKKFSSITIFFRNLQGKYLRTLRIYLVVQQSPWFCAGNGTHREVIGVG